MWLKSHRISEFCMSFLSHTFSTLISENIQGFSSKLVTLISKNIWGFSHKFLSFFSEPVAHCYTSLLSSVRYVWFSHKKTIEISFKQWHYFSQKSSDFWKQPAHQIWSSHWSIIGFLLLLWPCVHFAVSSQSGRGWCRPAVSGLRAGLCVAFEGLQFPREACTALRWASLCVMENPAFPSSWDKTTSTCLRERWNLIHIHVQL